MLKIDFPSGTLRERAYNLTIAIANIRTLEQIQQLQLDRRRVSVSDLLLVRKFALLEYLIFKIFDVMVYSLTHTSGTLPIYQLVSPECIYLLLIYAKSDREDITVAEIEAAID